MSQNWDGMAREKRTRKKPLFGAYVLKRISANFFNIPNVENNMFVQIFYKFIYINFT